jgi:two-component system, NtrC family, response regulator AtoC
VRELENVVQRACILVEGRRITLDELPAPMVAAASASAGAVPGPSGTLRDQLRRLEGEIVGRAIGEAGGDRRLAALRLGISLSSLYSKLSRADEDGSALATDEGAAAGRNLANRVL